MVNVLKRMRGLQALYQIRHGQGAAILPPSPLPQLTSVRLQYDRQQWNKSTRPARVFHQELLARLKYHNPGLPITIAQGPARLNLTFESADQADLKELERTALKESDDGEYRAEWSPVELKSQSSKATTTSSPSPGDSGYTRRVELRLGLHQVGSLWNWFETTTKCSPFPETEEESEKMAQLNAFFAQAEIDRQRVKAGMDEIRRQREELKKAREAAARMANEE